MRYCRAVFVPKIGDLTVPVPKTGGPKVEIDFGFFTQEQKNETLIRLRESYSDHSFQKYYEIKTPEWDIHATPLPDTVSGRNWVPAQP